MDFSGFAKFYNIQYFFFCTNFYVHGCQIMVSPGTCLASRSRQPLFEEPLMDKEEPILPRMFYNTTEKKKGILKPVDSQLKNKLEKDFDL